jgi:hypothetical protein
MGSFTSNLKLYKPDTTEFVDVDSQLNSNWTLCDKHVRRLLEYEFTTDSDADIYQALERSRYFKLYSNSPTSYFPSQGYFYQDPGAFVSAWVKAASFLTPPYIEHFDFPIGYRVIQKSGSPTTAEIEWTGAAWLNGSALPLNTLVSFMTLPSATIPVATKYFNQNAGNTSSSYSIARVSFSSGAAGTADMQYKRYGASSGTSSYENRIELTGIKYNVEVAAT